MTLTDEILAELRQGNSLSEIREKYRSRSQLYEALDKYLFEVDSVVDEKRLSLQKVSEELSECQTGLENIKAVRERISEEAEELRIAKEQLDSEVERASEKRERLQNEMKELQERGYTPDLLRKIRSVEPRSGAELWSDLRTVSRCREIMREAENVKQKKTSVEAEVKALEARRRDKEEVLRSVENELDNAKLQVRAFKEAASTINLFLKDGFSTKDLISLKAGLDLLGIKGEPRLSIARLVEGLREQKNLANLDEKVKEKTKELTALNEALAQVRKESQVIQSVTLNAIEEIRNASVKSIAETAEQGRAATDASSASFERRTAETLAQIGVQVQRVIGELSARLGKWGELQQEKARLEQFLIPAHVLLGILESPEYLNSLPLPLVVQLFERLQHWCEVNLKDFWIQPSATISAREFNLPTCQLYNLAVLVALVTEGLKQRMIQKST